ncbi:MAG: hypothetical protein K5669_07445 [Lachnospiraceae bacterium]|nr:hypothetical protein [Lachnospiraceae bacterium]
MIKSRTKYEATQEEIISLFEALRLMAGNLVRDCKHMGYVRYGVWSDAIEKM